MPEETQVEESEFTPPEWYGWDADQTYEYADDTANVWCPSCDQYRLLVYVPWGHLPLWLRERTRNDANAYSGRWCHAAWRDYGIRNLPDHLPLLRWDYLEGNGSFSIENGSPQDEEWCQGCVESWNEENDSYDSDDDESSEYVHDYSYRPTPWFFNYTPSNGLQHTRNPLLTQAGQNGALSPASHDGMLRIQQPHFGFELEMTRERANIGLDAGARLLYDSCGSFSYLKWDGSVGGGFELVTHPHTLAAYHQREVLWDALDKLRKSGWRSWNSRSSCGLHIHINTASFVSVGHAMRFLLFIYKNPTQLTAFAGRDSTYARFSYDEFVSRTYHDGWNDDGSPIYRRGSLADIVKKKSVNDNRYLAVNAQNNFTYELRFFRGNLNPSAVLACLEFTASLHEYTRELTSHDCLVNRALSWGSFLAFVRRKSADSDFVYKNLMTRLLQARRNPDHSFINTHGGESNN